jgi:hypothetical protein
MRIGSRRRLHPSACLLGAIAVLGALLAAACACNSTGSHLERIVVDPPDSCFHAVPSTHTGPVCAAPVVAYRNDCDHTLSVVGSDLAPGESGELAVGIPCSGTDCPVEVDWTVTGSTVDVLIRPVQSSDAGTPDDAETPSP